MIKIDMIKAKAIAHEARRTARAAEFKPFDDAIAKQIPGQMDGAETERQKIRTKYAALQIQIDAASSVQELKELMPK